MKKIICSLVLLLAMLFALTACGTFTCDLCDEEKKGKKYEFEIMGENGICCEECHDEIEELQKAFE